MIPAMFARGRSLVSRMLVAGRVALAALTLACSSPASTPSAAPGRGETAAVARSDVGFRTRALLLEHHRKHGREFGRIGVAEYLARAQSLRDRRAGGPVLEIVRGDGVITRFDRRSGEFLAFERSGVIRTFFRPNDGERYFRRQALRHGKGP